MKENNVNPQVSFVVPCYNLAHLLPECVNSILAQSYESFEILIMDDCSPDSTPVVANSFNDPRVRTIRNETNLGHLKNYNKGISLARGKYIWLISADDCLRRPLALERYVQTMEDNPGVGYVFCNAVGLQDGRETGPVTNPALGNRDVIYNGHDFLSIIINANCIPAPCGMVRKESYQKGLFPLDMPYAGDWYMWCLFALYYDVAFIGEPFVCYRYHDTNITKQLTRQSVQILVSDDIKVRWRILEKAGNEGFDKVVESCRESIIRDYISRIIKKEDEEWLQGLSYEEFELSIKEYARDEKERQYILTRVALGLGDYNDSCGRFAVAGSYYRKALQTNVFSLKLWLKYLLLRLGKTGVKFRNMIKFVRKRGYAQ